MASKPPQEPPESVVLQQFSGIKNTVAPERLSASDLERAINVDIDDAGQPRRRRGFALAASGGYHSLYDRTPGKVLGVRNEALGIVNPDYSFYALSPVSLSPLSYVTVGDDTYFSSFSHSGIIRADNSLDPWGAPVDATWHSPVITPTDTLGAISGKILKAPPLATEIELYKGRIYLANERMLWATELYQYNYVDITKTYLYFEDDITMLAAADDGVYVGTESGLWFLKGTFGTFQRQNVMSARVLPGSKQFVPTDRVHPMAQQRPMPTGDGVVFMTDQGICAAFDGGECYNLTQGRVVFPTAQSVASLYREDLGGNSYVAVADSRGSPTANTRIGDYVDAEIRRFQG